MRQGFVLFSRIVFVFVFLTSLVPSQSVSAAAELELTPITWNVVGLDSNNVNVGPNNFPVGVRVCNTGDAPATNVEADFVWDSTNGLINLRPGSLDPILIPSLSHLAPNNCYDFYFEVEVTRNAAAYDTTRRYHIEVTADGGIFESTPTPREIFVERLISQNRNSTLDVQLDGASIAPGGTMSLVVGETYTITLVAKTATQGYEQIESFINFPNTIFQVLSVDTTYTAETSSSMASPYDTLYGDACVWQNDPNSPQYRDCLATGKAGGNITVEYEVTIISGGGSSGILNSLIYDFSGSSYHYNSDYSVGGRIYSILDPSLVDISKNFAPDPTNAGGTSVLTFTLTNGNASSVSDVNFTDAFPTTPGAMTVASPLTTSNTCGGTLQDNLGGALAAGDAGIRLIGGTIAANGSCVISVSVSVPTAGPPLYNNISDNLFVGTVDTGNNATDTLTVNNTPPPPACVAGLPMATWNFLTGSSATNPAPTSSGVTASAAAGSGLNPVISTQNTAGASGSWASDFIATGVLNTANNEYFEFTLDTTGFESVTLSFSGRRTSQGPQNIQLYFGITPTTASDIYSLPAQNTWYSMGPTVINTGLNPSGNTVFRLYTYNASQNNSGHSVFVDGVTFTGCGVPQHPTLTKSFSPDPVAVGGASTLTFAVTNPNASVALSGLAFTDNLPAGVTVATSGPTAVCGGSLSTTGPSTITFTGGSLAASASCTIPVPVTVTTAGPHTNISGFISSTQSGTNTTPTGYATDTITAILPPTISKLFAPNPILAGGTSTLTFSITNPNTDQPLSGVAFTDTFPVAPAAMTVASPTGASALGCGTPTFAPTIGAGSISFSNRSIAAGGTCLVTVNVTAPSNGNYANTSGAVTAIIAGSPVGTDTASDDLDVVAPNPGIAILKQVGLTNDPNGAWYSFLPVAEGVDVYYKITIENTGDVPLSSVSVNDPDVSTVGCTWTNPLPVADVNDDDHIDFCVIGPVEAVTGLHDNTATATGTYGGSPYTDTSTAIYATPELTLTKSATQSYFVAEGDTINYSYLVENTGEVPLLGPVTVADDKTTVTCPAVNTVGDNDNYLDLGESITCTATYTILAGDVTAGFVTNIAEASAGGVDSNEDDVTVPRQLPDLTITKTNNTSDTGTVGVPFNWILTVNNTGTLAATFTDGQTLLSDPLPAAATYGVPTLGGFTGITNDGSISCSIVLNNLTCTASGNNVTIGATTGSFTVTIPVTPTTGGNLENTATVDPNNNITESNETNNTGSNTVFIAAPAITVVKEVSVDGGTSWQDANSAPGPDLASGTDPQFRFTVTNTGNVTLTNIGLTDTDIVSFAESDLSTACTIPASLAAGADFTCYAELAWAPDQHTNTANVTGDYNGTTYPDSDSANYFGVAPAYTIVKSVTSTGPYGLNDAIDYEITVENTGNVAITGVNVTDNLVTLTRGADNPGNNDNTLNVGETWVYTGSYTVLQSDLDNNGGGDGDIDNIAEVTSTEIPTPQTDSEAGLLDVAPAYTIVKNANVSSVNAAGNVIPYTITITNTGNILLTGVDVSDPMLADLDCDAVSNGYQTTGFSIAVDGSLTCTGSYSVTASDITTNGGGDGDIDNTASVISTQITTPQDSSVEVDIEPADLSLTKMVDNSSPVIGNNVTFTLTLTNNGPSGATGVSVLDLLPAGLSYVSDNSASTATTYNSGTGVWTIGSLASGDSISLEITVQVTQAGTLTNTAEVRTSDQFDPNSTPNNNVPSENDQASAVVGGIFDPPSALKTFNDAGLPELEFRMVWINSSNIAAIDVQVTDNIPAGTTYVDGSIDCDPQGSSSTVNAGVFTTPVSPLIAAVPAWSCGFDEDNNRVQWQGTIGPDDGNLTEAEADNEVIITFRVTVNNAVNQVQNTGSSRTDINDNSNFDEETVLNTSVINSNIVIWNRTEDPNPDPDPDPDPETPPSSLNLPLFLPVTGFAPDIVSALPEQPASKAYSATGVWLEIPSLGVQMPIVGVPLVEEDWDVSWLGNQAGWLEGTAFPSWKGNSAVTGHVTLANGASGPFAKLGNLKWGDTVVVHAYGYVYTYQVRENKVVAPNNMSVLKHETDSWLTLITCKNYNEATDTYANRVSVRAVLISVQKEPAKLIPLGVR